MSFVHLHNHTNYSLLDGAATIERYIKKAQKTGMTSLAITDHGNMFGAIEFYKMCRKAGINPIIGCEFCISHSHKERANKNQHHLIALAMSDKGYHNLMKLSSFAYKGGLGAVLCITHDVLESHNEDLIVLSAGIDGEVAESLLSGDYEKAKHIALWYKGVFGDRYYLEIQDHGLADEKKVLPLIKRLFTFFCGIEV